MVKGMPCIPDDRKRPTLELAEIAHILLMLKLAAMVVSTKGIIPGLSFPLKAFPTPKDISIAKFGWSNKKAIRTDRRVYHVELHSIEGVPYQAVVSWSYPTSMVTLSSFQENNKAPKPLSGLSNKKLNFNYHFVAKARPSWMPKRVFDDGHKTYIEFPSIMQDVEAPGLWGLSKAKEQETLNYRRYRNFYIVDHLIDLAELSIGGTDKVVVGIERDVP